MASFSRAFPMLSCRTPLSAQRACMIPSQLHAARPRLFTTSLSCRNAARNTAKVTKPTTKPTPPASQRPPPSKATAAPSRYAFIKSLATKPSPTILYEAPSHFWFYFGCWFSGLGLVSWTVLSGPSVVQQPDGIPQWVGSVFVVSYVLLGSMGFYLVSKTPNIVGKIRLLPVQAMAQATGSVATKTNPRIEITVKRMVPLLTPKVITTDLENVVLKTRFSLPGEYVPELKRLENKREEEMRKAALRKWDMDHLFTMPFRRVGRAVSNLFRGVKAAWTDIGFGVIRVDGKQYKVDVMKGFAHDGFRTLERVVDIGWK